MTIFKLPNLKSIAITDSKVHHVVSQNITNLSSLQCLNLSNNNIHLVDDNLIKHLPKLELLDLSFNNLTNLSMTPPTNNNFSLDVSNNTRLRCTYLQDLNNITNLNILNPNNTMCITVQKDYWFKYEDPVPYHELEKFKQIEQYCKIHTPCTCVVHRVIYLRDTFRGISVNCNGKNLTSLPEITNLKRIKTDPNYNDLLQLYAQNNQISSLQDIEGSDFIKKFQYLDIRDNKLNEIQTYIFSNVFENSRVDYLRVKLAGNKIKCDCNTAQQIKFWLLKHVKIIDDYENILCENFNTNIMSLDANKVCKYPRVWTDYINYIIAAEVVMLFLLISKVSYDYWVFRTAGYLPWPASKMPKMPCDWVLEA
ncbi:hypothetical protein L9F63_000314 [Diploptera punctata]|uniref:Protein halfway n=1 Tax=Diploptera punctata TaxID=6984 RepID=A0AAD8ETC7_DIPPU|nr:hypothetical protein L9F63_000314 [Diploptera punctata]